MSIEVSKLTKESLMILVAGVSLFIAAVLLRYAVVPMINQMRLNFSQYNEMKSRISSESGLINVIKDIKVRNEKISKKLDSYYGVSIDDTKDISGFLEHLIKCAKTSDVRFVKMEPGPEKNESGTISFPVTLQFTSTYNALGKFVNAVEKNPHMYRVEGLFVEARSEGRVEAKIGIVCSVPVKEK